MSRSFASPLRPRHLLAPQHDMYSVLGRQTAKQPMKCFAQIMHSMLTLGVWQICVCLGLACLEHVVHITHGSFISHARRCGESYRGNPKSEVAMCTKSVDALFGENGQGRRKPFAELLKTSMLRLRANSSVYKIETRLNDPGFVASAQAIVSQG